MKKFETPEMAKKAREERAARAEYEVGYCKTPKQHRFSKGKSGNPKGRPKRKRNTFYEDVMSVLGQKINVTRDGKPLKVTQQKALVQSIMVGALKGKRWARKDMIELLKLLFLIEAPGFDGDEDFP